jgi:predicted MPP superfamily phosphohydrolase
MPVIGFFLYLGACAGHAALLVFHLNSWYGHALPEKLLSILRNLTILLIMAGPAALWWVAGFDLAHWPVTQSTTTWGNFLTVYVGFCWLAGLVVVPWVTMGRLLRRPASLASNHTRTIDIALQLGYKPFGRGRNRYMAHFPRNEIFRVDFTEKTLRLPRVPAAWDGLTILHLSDLHLHGSPDRAFFEQVMEECGRWEPDLVALTGDVVDSNRHHRWILPLLSRLRWRSAAFAVMGNHDYWHDPQLVRRRLRRLGIDVLANAWKQIDVRGTPLVVIGNESPWFRPAPDLSACPQDIFRLCLSHTPDNVGWARRQQIDLVLAGHNHGGQIRFPIIGSVLVPSRFSRRYDCGLFEEPPTVMHVSRGLSAQHPLRYNCRPEVTKLVLSVTGQ